MSKRIQILAAIALAFVWLAAEASHAQTKPKSNSDEAALRRIVQQLQDGWNARDGKAFAAPFAADADYVVVNGLKIKGKDTIEKGHTRIFATVYKDSHNVATGKAFAFCARMWRWFMSNGIWNIARTARWKPGTPSTRW